MPWISLIYLLAYFYIYSVLLDLSIATIQLSIETKGFIQNFIRKIRKKNKLTKCKKKKRKRSSFIQDQNIVLDCLRNRLFQRLKAHKVNVIRDLNNLFKKNQFFDCATIFYAAKTTHCQLYIIFIQSRVQLKKIITFSVKR